jgi:tetratricopeptide (TPR) repeat protein
MRGVSSMSGQAILMLWLATAPAAGGEAQSEFQRYFSAAMRLHETMDYERALEQLKAAKALPHGAGEDVALALYEGLFLFDLGHKEQALQAFRAALSLDIEARFPMVLSPTITNALEAERKKLRAVAARVPSPPAPAAAPAPSPEPAKSPAPSPEQPAATAQPAPAPTVEQSSSLRSWGWLPLAGGLALGGAAAATAVVAKSRYDEIKAQQVSAATAASDRDQGKTLQATSFVLAGVGVAAVAAGIVVFALGPSRSPAQVKIGGGPGQVLVSGVFP